MRTYFLFSMNGAAIRGYETYERALRHARQWKASHVSERVVIEELERGTNRLMGVTHVELPMLVPLLTPRHDFEDGSGVA